MKGSTISSEERSGGHEKEPVPQYRVTLIFHLNLSRSHDKVIGKEFYQNLTAVRDSLGLSYRFEILFDDGHHFPTIADHFHRRLRQWKGKHRVNGMHEATAGGGERGGAGRSDGRHAITSYKELENLPCLVVLAGESRAGLSFPSNLWFVDLRLCYPIGNITRHQYEYDTSFFNGYYRMLTKTTPTPDPGCPREKDRVDGSSTAESVVSVNNECVCVCVLVNRFQV